MKEHKKLQKKIKKKKLQQTVTAQNVPYPSKKIYEKYFEKSGEKKKQNFACNNM